MQNRAEIRYILTNKFSRFMHKTLFPASRRKKKTSSPPRSLSRSLCLYVCLPLCGSPVALFAPHSAAPLPPLRTPLQSLGYLTLPRSLYLPQSRPITLRLPALLPPLRPSSSAPSFFVRSVLLRPPRPSSSAPSLRQKSHLAAYHIHRPRAARRKTNTCLKYRRHVSMPCHTPHRVKPHGFIYRKLLLFCFFREPHCK